MAIALVNARPLWLSPQDQASQQRGLDEVGAPEALPLTQVLLTFPNCLGEGESFFGCVGVH